MTKYIKELIHLYIKEHFFSSVPLLANIWLDFIIDMSVRQIPESTHTHKKDITSGLNNRKVKKPTLTDGKSLFTN